MSCTTRPLGSSNETLRCQDVPVTADPALLDLVAPRGGSCLALPAADGSVHAPTGPHPVAPLDPAAPLA